MHFIPVDLQGDDAPTCDLTAGPLTVDNVPGPPAVTRLRSDAGA